MQFQIPTMLFSLSAFLILMYFVSRFALRPMLSMMKKREDHISEQLQKAEKNRIEAENALKEQTEALTRARKEARSIIDKAKVQKDVEANEILKQAQERADRIIENGVQEIQREKEKALESLRDEVGSLSIKLASRVLEQEVTEKKHSQLVKSYLKEIGRAVQ